jgi:hypothetical protein
MVIIFSCVPSWACPSVKTSGQAVHCNLCVFKEKTQGFLKPRDLSSRRRFSVAFLLNSKKIYLYLET